jgi:hypothetical protein
MFSTGVLSKPPDGLQPSAPLPCVFEQRSDDAARVQQFLRHARTSSDFIRS